MSRSNNAGDARSPTSNTRECNRRQQVTFQEDSFEVTSFSHLQLVPKRKSISPRKGIDESSGGNDSSILSEGCTSAAESTHAASRKQRQLIRTRWYRRLLMLLTATLIGFFISGVVFYATRLAEVEAFEQAFAELGQQVLEIVRDELSNKLLALDSLSIALTSQALAQAQATSLFGVWPMTTLPDFTVRAMNMLATADSRSVVFAPLIHNGTLGIWNEFLASNSGEWELDLSSSSTTWAEEQRLRIPTASTTSQSLLDDPETSFRVWQHYPRSNNLVNANLLAPPSPSLLALLSNRTAVIGDIVPLSLDAEDSKDEVASPLNHYLSTILSADVSKPRTGGDAKENLVSNIHYPIFDSLIVPDSSSIEPNSRSLVGMLSMDIVWQDFLGGTNPVGTKDEIVCVLRNQCGQVYTFKVRYDRVIYVTKGDAHPTEYNDMVEETGLNSFELSSSKKFQGNFQSELDDFCLYELQVYPSISLEEQYLTFKPALYTASTAFCFVVLLILSLAYERRVARVHENSIQYRNVVVNLFPPAVRRRMFRRQEESRKKGKQGGLVTRGSALSRDPSTAFQGKSNPHAPILSGISPRLEKHGLALISSKPIADHFPESSVFFADIAGFTSWSSQRSPEQVFTLLQTLFNTFDGIAKKCRVFKVETIGDCYMAVTGVPEPQADHAVRMTKFARVCLCRVKPLLERLELTLGKGTQDLAIRVGIHSGPVTAGVLEGEKSRFQLFGDTVNTASRMESNGEPGRIHISRATADLLVQAKKDHWLEKRQDPIHAKGKGLMETFWIRRSTTRHRTPDEGKAKNVRVPSEFHESTDLSDSEFLSDSDILFSSFNTSVTSRLSDVDGKLWSGSSRGSGIALDDKDIVEFKAAQNVQYDFGHTRRDNLYRFAFIED